MSRVNFLKKTRRLAAQRAGYRCSFPGCGRVTIGPGPTPDTVFETGKASHVYAASAGGPRGQGALTEDELRSIRNCIWLCPTHADLVDLHRGDRFPASVLYGYRDLHESRVSREIGDVPSVEGWIESVCLGANPLFVPESQLTFGKATVFYGLNGTGKSALLEWLAAAFSSPIASRWSGSDIELSVRFLDSERAHDLEFSYRRGQITCVLDGKLVPFNPLDLSMVVVTKERVPGSKAPIHRIADQVGVSPSEVSSLIPFIGRDPETLISSVTSIGAGDLAVVLPGDPPPGLPFNSVSASQQELVVIECAIVRASTLSQHRPVLLCLDADFGVFDSTNAAAVLRRVSSPELRFQSAVVVHDSRADLTGWQTYGFVGSGGTKTIERLIGS
jgi:hypothetical protein